MKNILYAFALILITTSCSKWKGNKELVYYSTDFEQKDMTILGNSTSDIDALWFEFHRKDKGDDYNAYTLIVKSNGTMSKETGTCQIDWNQQITFNPTSQSSYIGTWQGGKEKFAVNYELEDRTETLTFIYKETGHCKKW